VTVTPRLPSACGGAGAHASTRRDGETVEPRYRFKFWIVG
jgi:hypothetical protein